MNFITFHHQSDIWSFLLFKVLESWSWRIGRADCSRSSGSEWLWKVNIFTSASPAGSFFLSPPSVPPLRPPEDRGGAGQGEADLEWDVGRGGAAEWPGSPLGGAEASREGGRQGPRGCYALQRLQPQLGLRVEPQWSSLRRISLNTCSSECIKDSHNTHTHTNVWLPQAWRCLHILRPNTGPVHHSAVLLSLSVGGQTNTFTAFSSSLGPLKGWEKGAVLWQNVVKDTFPSSKGKKSSLVLLM